MIENLLASSQIANVASADPDSYLFEPWHVEVICSILTCVPDPAGRIRYFLYSGSGSIIKKTDPDPPSCKNSDTP
jgi:hypothetical protein